MLVASTIHRFRAFIKALGLLVWLAITTHLPPVQADNLIEMAQQFEASGNYRSAVATYQRYLSDNPPKSAATRLARIKLPVLQETVRYGLESEIIPFLTALDYRAMGLTEDALLSLQQQINNYPGGRLVDDAIFMSAYISMMDHYDFANAADTLQQLISDYPDSPYVDTALYSIAIAKEQSGNLDAAVDTLTRLRDRHNSLSIAGITWAQDSFLSRFWFERADNRLAHLQQHKEKASQLVSLETLHGSDFQYQAVVRAQGREFVLLLNESQLISAASIVTDVGATVTTSNTKTYEGRLQGIEDSWARISINNGNLRGLITLPEEQIRLHQRSTGGTLADFHPLLLGDNDGNRSDAQDEVLYPPQPAPRLNVGGLDIGGLESTVQAQVIGADRRVLASDAATSNNSVKKVARLGVVVDSKFNNYFAGRGVDEALSILNSSDGIFRQQMGIALNVAKVILIEDTKDDPMNLGSVTMETMMRNFREYRMGDDVFSSEIGLATLFSGNKNSDSALGLAWIGSACRTDGFDVSVVSPYYLAELLSTHEIGHTLGAPHDSDTACVNQTSNIMWPFLSTGTEQQFSSCSKQSVGSLLAASTCHVDAVDLSVDIDTVSETDARISVNSLSSTHTASGVQVAIETSAEPVSLPDECSNLGQTTVNCLLTSLHPTETKSFLISLDRPIADGETLRAEVSLTSAIDVETSNNVVELDASGNTTMVNQPGNPADTFTLNTDEKRISSGSGSINPIDIIFALSWLFCWQLYLRFGTTCSIRVQRFNQHR